MEITIDTLRQLAPDTYILIDIRDKEEAQKNPIPNGIVLSDDEISTYPFDPTKKSLWSVHKES